MPGNNWSPRIGLLSGIDWRAFAGQAIFKRLNGVVWENITIPALSSTYTARYEDLLEALNGRGVEPGCTLQADASAQWAAAGVISVGLNINDRLQLMSTTVPFDISIGPSQSDVWGGPVGGGIINVDTGPPYSYTFPREWQRANATQAQFLLNDGVGLIFLPNRPHISQSPLYHFRTMDEGDLDALAETTNLAYLDRLAIRNFAGLGAAIGVSWGIDSDGYVWASWRDAWLVGDPQWLAAGRPLAELLGFDGNETSTIIESVLSGDVRYFRANNRCAYALLPRRQPNMVLPGRTEETNTVRLLNGDLRSNRLSYWKTWDVGCVLDGTAMTVLNGFDEVDHYQQRFLPHAQKGARVGLYQEWGETRRARASTGYNISYNTLYTHERNGRRGRVLCRRSDMDEGVHTIGYDRAIESRSEEVSLMLDEIP